MKTNHVMALIATILAILCVTPAAANAMSPSEDYCLTATKVESYICVSYENGVAMVSAYYETNYDTNIFVTNANWEELYHLSGTSCHVGYSNSVFYTPSAIANFRHYAISIFDKTDILGLNYCPGETTAKCAFLVNGEIFSENILNVCKPEKFGYRSEAYTLFGGESCLLVDKHGDKMSVTGYGPSTNADFQMNMSSIRVVQEILLQDASEAYETAYIIVGRTTSSEDVIWLIRQESATQNNKLYDVRIDNGNINLTIYLHDVTVVIASYGEDGHMCSSRFFATPGYYRVLLSELGGTKLKVFVMDSNTFVPIGNYYETSSTTTDP